MSGDSERGARFRELFDRLLLLRAEVNALTGLMVLNEVCTPDELRNAIGMEAEQLSDEFEKQFPGIVSLPIPNRLEITDEKLAAETMKGWPQ